MIAVVLGHRALVMPLEANESTESGVVLPDLVRDQESRGLVMLVGDAYAGDTEPPVEKGDVVVYAAGGTRNFSAPLKVRIDLHGDGKAENFVVVEYADILIVLKEDS